MSESPPAPSRIAIRGGFVDLDRRELHRDGEVHRLTSTEHQLLAWMAGRAGELVPTEELLTQVWGYRASARTRAVHNAVLRLRRKLERDPAEPAHLFTERGDGFRLVPLEETVSVPVVAAPVRRTSDLVGRIEELDTLHRWLGQGSGPLTIVGPGGAGKTRLARELAGQTSAHTFCALAAVRDEDELVAHLCEELGLTRPSRTPLIQALSALGDQLLVLDNAEQIVADLAELVAELQRATPRLRILTTSREPLGLADETVLRLEGLSLEDSRTLARLRQTGQPDSTANLDDLWTRVEGLPLAIELVAAHLPLLGGSTLLSRFDETLLRLPSRRRDRPARHRSLESTLRWSWELLDRSQRDALARLSVFLDDFRPDVATRLLASPVGAVYLADLVERGLLDRTGDRLRLSVPVRLFAAERLAERPELQVTVLRLHAELLAEQGTWTHLTALDTSPGSTLRDAVAREGPARERALANALEFDWIDLLPGLSLALWAARYQRGSLHALGGLPVEELTVDLTGDDHAHLCFVVGSALLKLGQHARSATVLEDGLAHAQGTARGRIGAVLGLALHRSQCPQEALERLAQAREHAREAGDLVVEGIVASNDALVRLELVDFDGSARAAQRALHCHRAAGNRRSEALVLNNMGNRLAIEGRAGEAAALLQQALAMHESLGNRRSAAISMGNLGRVMVDLGHFDAAREGLEEAERRHRALGNLRSAISTLGNQAFCAVMRGDHAHARTCALQAQAEATRHGLISLICTSTTQLAGIELAESDWARGSDAMESAVDRLQQVRPESARGWWGPLSYSLARVGRTSEALQWAQRCLDEDHMLQMHVYGWLTRAHVRRQQGDAAGATAAVSEARACLTRPPPPSSPLAMAFAFEDTTGAGSPSS